MKSRVVGSLLVTVILATIVRQIGNMDYLAIAKRLMTEMDGSVNLVDEVARTALSDTGDMDLPGPLKEQVESMVEMKEVIGNLMPFVDMAEEALGEATNAESSLLPLTTTPVVLVGNNVTLNPVAIGWEGAGGGSLTCSSTFRITKAGPWQEGDAFYVAVEFIDLEGRQAGRYVNYMSSDVQTEWVIDMAKGVEVGPVPWCGSAVITVQDDILDPDALLSERYQVQVELLNTCNCGH